MKVEYAEPLIENTEGLPRDTLKYTLEIFSQDIWLTSHNNDIVYKKRVSPEEVAYALTRAVTTHSGLLPEQTIAYKQGVNGRQYALFRPAKVWKAKMARSLYEPPAEYNIPMPPLMFICRGGTPPRIYALKDRPQAVTEMAYKAPTLNTFESGLTCAGTHEYPQRVEVIPESFFESLFSPTADHAGRSARHPLNILDMWQELNGQDEYPLEDLVPQQTIEKLLQE